MSSSPVTRHVRLLPTDAGLGTGGQGDKNVIELTINSGMEISAGTLPY